MHNKFYYLIFFILLSNEIVLGKNGNTTKVSKKFSKSVIKTSDKVTNGRSKRSSGVFDKFLNHMAQEIGNGDRVDFEKDVGEENIGDTNLVKEPPFWGTRGRRDSSESMEFVRSNDLENGDNPSKMCNRNLYDMQQNKIKDEIVPFWSNRGRREPDEVGEYNPFWGNRGRRQDDAPFWGNRGRRDKVKEKSQDIIEDSPFWSSRGRRDDPEPFWGNRGRRDESEPFWGNRGRRDDIEPFWGNRGRRDDIEPFWGNRGRRDDNEPFWGNRGRRQENEPFSGSRGRRKIQTFWGNDGKKKEYGYWNVEDTNPFWGIKGRKKFALKENIINAMNNIEYDVENLARMRRGDEHSILNYRSLENRLKNLFQSPSKNIASFRETENKPTSAKLNFKPTEHNRVFEDQMYAEEPHYILIERNTRSSAEEDPFFISRGKKYTNFKLSKGFRDRRGSIEDLVKSVRNDPYYIARGKKDSEYVKIGNSTILKDEFVKAKELICSAIDLLVIKSDDHKVKREVDDSDRERRTTLKKLAAQLQIDPYFVSRGKKSEDVVGNGEDLEEFVNHVAGMCN